MRTPVIGVMGGGAVDDDTRALAEGLGRAIAGEGWHLLNGGRDAGVMAASAKGAHEAGGTVIGVLPTATDDGASPHLDIVIRTGMGSGRNVINVLSSEVIVVLPGSSGTLSEAALAAVHGVPTILLGFEGNVPAATHAKDVPHAIRLIRDRLA